MTTTRGRTEWQKLVDDKLNDHDRRLTEHEKENAVYRALQDEQRQHLNNRFDRLQDNINNTKTDLTAQVNTIKSGINRVLWAIGIAVALAIVQWILAGGLTVIAK